MKHAKTRCRAFTATLLIAVLAGCDGRTPSGDARNNDGRLELQTAKLGRLVDIYSYQRIDPDDTSAGAADRRRRANRKFELVASNVLINPNLESQVLFDAAGQEVPTASFEFLPFDKRIGHEELAILWDNRPGPEAAKFEAALAGAQLGLLELAPSYRGQNTQTRPIPIVPRNAAIQLQFSDKITVDKAFFDANPSAIQLLEFKGDPNVVTPADAFRIVPYRLVVSGNRIVLDTTILGGEGSAGGTTPGLPPSADNVTANMRIAIPSRGSVVSSFYVREDAVPTLNDLDSAGRNSVIRDFRSGNLGDGAAGRLREPETPMIVASLGMGVTDVDTATNIITINKRSQFVPVRGRYPFVDGPLDATGLPLGPVQAPVSPTLRSGDFLTQTIQVLMPDLTFESVTLRAEILQNMDIGTVVGEPLGQVLVGPPTPGSLSPDQGAWLPVARVRVASVFGGKDSLGREWAFRSNTLPSGQDCTVRALYYEDVRSNSGTELAADKYWRQFFVRVDPQPTGGQPLASIDPNASIAIEFTKPMDLNQIDNTANFLVTNRWTPPPPSVPATTLPTATPPNPAPLQVLPPETGGASQLGTPKEATRHIVPTRLSDLAGDGTVLRLQPPMGFFHRLNQPETYAAHVRLGTTGVTDLAGSPLEIFDQVSAPQSNWSVNFSLAPTALANQVLWHTWCFSAEDEDGSAEGSSDIFGQYRLENGRLIGASGIRFSRSADNQNLGAIARDTRGECWDSADAAAVAPVPPDPTIPTVPVINGQVHPRLLYWQPRMSDTIGPTPVPAPQVFEYWQQIAHPVGRVVEPHKPQGSRMQMRYLEDDFTLDYRQPSEFGIDVEQLYWSPFNDEVVLFDVFDRYTMSLAHSARRTDERFELLQGACWFIPQSLNSGLSNTFSENILPGTKLTPVFEDKVYAINPNTAFRTAFGTKFVPFPRFDRSYTWRDSRLVTIDASGNVIGLGGAQQPGGQAPNDDQTANIDSPWIASAADPEFLAAGFTTWVVDPGDFQGNLQLDHDPIALPLLVDFKVFPDSAANGVSNGANGFQVAMLGPPSNFANPAGPIPGGYYDSQPANSPGTGGRPNWPHVRVQASGGEDLVTGLQNFIDPANQLAAQGSSVKDAGLGNPARGLFIAPAGDGMLNWAHAEFVRKVSTMTFGFFDTLRPQWASQDPINGTFGIPDVSALGADSGWRISDMVVQADPPQARQPAGTSVVVELRCAETFGNDVLYDPLTNDTFDGRGNMLNPNYSCEAYRYSTANNGGLPRIPATGMTQYVTDTQINLLRVPATGLLPRYVNLRVVMTNNTDVTPALSPSLRSLTLVYRMQLPQ